MILKSLVLLHVLFRVSFRCELIADSYLVDNTKEDGFPDVGERLIEEVAN